MSRRTRRAPTGLVHREYHNEVVERLERSGLDAYQRDAARTMSSSERAGVAPPAILGLGIAGEAGEVADLLKKHLGHGHELDRDKLVKEIGDVLWYVAALATWLGVPLSEVAEKNIEKLKARYPNGFDSERSKNR